MEVGDFFLSKPASVAYGLILAGTKGNNLIVKINLFIIGT
jgi:hypothetical protein